MKVLFRPSSCTLWRGKCGTFCERNLALSWRVNHPLHPTLIEHTVRRMATVGEIQRPLGKLAYVSTHGRSPGVMFCCGYGSDMSGTKAKALEEYCVRENRSYVRFDYFGCGKSDGDFHSATLGQWKADSLEVLDKLTEEPQILVGSSMGGWLMLLLAEERPDRVHALVGVAAAPEFTRWRNYSDQVIQDLQTKGVAFYETPYGPMSISKVFMDESKNHLVFDKPSLNIKCPVRLLHGMKDDSVPYDISVQVVNKVLSDDVDLILRKAGDHRLSKREDIQLLIETVDKLTKC